ncbi:MAG: hypothetical protein KBF78_14850 [Fuscovulum sp.]|nr:hypothetical protein [Fuscovulum sp.]
MTEGTQTSAAAAGEGPEHAHAQDPGGDPKAVRKVLRQARRHARARRRHRPRVGLWLVLGLVGLALVLGVVGMALTGRALTLPVWAVAEIESRLNRTIAGSHLPEGAALAVGEIDLALDRDFTPRFHLRDLRLIDPSGRAVLALPEIAVALEPGAALLGQVRPASVRLLGAHFLARRDAEGRIGLSIGGISGAQAPQSAADVLDALDQMFSTPALAGLRVIEADALTLELTDDRAGRQWQLGDGRLVIENTDRGLAAELGVTLLDGTSPAQARLTIETDKATSAARVIANLDGMAAADLAAQAAPLAVLGLVDAPISGRMLGELDASGRPKGFEGTLTLGQGAVRPNETAQAFAFDRAEIALRYDAGRQRITLGNLRVESPSVRLRARGNAELQDGAGGLALAGRLPGAVVGQLSLTEVRIDPEGLFAEPVAFDTGALAMRVTLSPLRIEIGELSLGEGADQLRLDGDLRAVAGGWEGGLDVSLGRISADRLVKLWPVSVVPKTRAWLAANVGQGTFLNLDAGLRIAPGQEPRFALDYDFEEAEVRFIRTLPPVRDGQGRASIFGNVYTVVLERGHVVAPQGGLVDATGSVLRVPDLTVFPALAEVRLTTVSTLTAALSLLDQEPFRFLSKADRPVDLGQGTAVMVSDLAFPLKERIGVEDVTYAVTGTVHDFTSDRLVAGRVIALPKMAVTVTPAGLELAGKGQLESLPFEATFRQPFGPEAGGRAFLSAGIAVTDARLRDLGVALPEGWLAGETAASVEMEIPKTGAVTMTARSALTGARLTVAPLGWSKAAKTAGRLDLRATLGARPSVDELRLTAPGLEAAGNLTTTEGGSLDRLRLDRLRAGDWLDAAVDVIGRGRNRPVGLEVRGGRLDLRAMPGGAGGGEGGGTEIKVALDRLVVSAGITLTNFRGAFVTRGGGLDGRFTSSVNGAAGIDGAAVPDHGRTAIRITTRNAGAVMAAAGIFDKGRGGQLDLTLSPRGPEGQYVGIAAFTNLSVQDAPALAALLSAISVVGLLEQMGGNGLVFDSGDVEFVMSRSGVQFTRGTAVGASLGISFEGAYSSGSGRLDLQGVISPIYILNGIGQIFARKGEGLFGFNYRLSGPADDPSVSVNPLSILTPGMFREIFRRPPPRIEGNG